MACQPDSSSNTICCVECSSCGYSHALEPSVIVSHCSYSIGFLLHLMYAKLTNAFPTIEALCFHFGISVSNANQKMRFPLSKYLDILRFTIVKCFLHTKIVYLYHPVTQEYCYPNLLRNVSYINLHIQLC